MRRSFVGNGRTSQLLSAIRTVTFTRYSKTHEWIVFDSETKKGTLGVTNYAQSEFGDVTRVELTTKVGENVKAFDCLGDVNCLKADVYSVDEFIIPCSGTISEINSAVISNPHLINKDPEDTAWVLKVTDASLPLAGLLTKEQYLKFVDAPDKPKGEKAKLYSRTHEWIEFDPHTRLGTVGITDHAQKLLGEIVYINVEKIGAVVSPGESLGEVESSRSDTRASDDITSPCKGEIVEVNRAIVAKPESVNLDAEKSGGWIVKLKNVTLGPKLMTEHQYKQFCGTDPLGSS